MKNIFTSRLSRQDYHRLIEKLGHKLVRDADTNEIDSWQLDFENHNGPGCVYCGVAWCDHCREIPKKCSKSQ